MYVRSTVTLCTSSSVAAVRQLQGQTDSIYYFYQLHKTRSTKAGNHLCVNGSYERLANSEVYMIPFPQSKPYGQTRVNPDGCRSANIEVPTTEVARDSGRLFFSERSWTFVWTKGGSRGPSKGAIILIILLMSQAGGLHIRNWRSWKWRNAGSYARCLSRHGHKRYQRRRTRGLLL